MTDNRLLDLVDDRDFRILFVEELGWNNPDRPDLTVEVEDNTFTLQQVANYKGLRIWHCPVLPPRKIQRQIDVLVGQDNQERLVIFTNEQRQEWRWPRRAQLGSANAKLLVHEHIVGDRSTHLTGRLQAIELDFDENISLVTLLDRMRDAFDHEAESASVAAARLMGTLYIELETCGVGEHDATLLLARLLFLMFGDDADMWKPEGLFERYLQGHTTWETLHTDLQGLFEVLDTDEKKRNLPSNSPYADFRYINGGLFHDLLRLPPLNAAFRNALIEACKFDWSIISPAVFGSMFQTVKSKEDRRRGGEHYTTEENILKTIRPLFLDEYRERLERAWNDKAQLTKLHNELGRLRFLDPACGCGNFLIVAYKELRALELELLTRRRELDMTEVASKKVTRAQLSLDVTGDIKVTLDHFFGIEIEEWPARIAETAMLLVDHLANQQMAVEFGMAPDRLPIEISPTIIHANAVSTDWASILPPSNDTIVMGNPPFVGMAWLTPEQQSDNRSAFGQIPESKGLRSGRLDYVASWYAKALSYLQGTYGRAAFVSTNSITQGEQARTMVPLLDRCGFEVDFGHQTFKWTTEASKGAAVHCVIVGFSAKDRPGKRKRLYTYPNLTSKPHESIPRQLNFYLVDGPNLVPEKLRAPLVNGMPMSMKGSQPTEGGHLLVDQESYSTVASDPVAAKYLRRFVQGRYMLNSTPYWCLWLKDAPPEEIRKSTVIQDRLSKVRAARLQSPTKSVQEFAKRPHLFTQDRQPEKRYFALPEVSSENRKWIPGRFYDPEFIAGNKLIIFPGAQEWHAALLQSSMFMTWVHTFAGRLESRPSISPGLAYFPIPFPQADESLRKALASSWALIEDARSAESGSTLVELYSTSTMPTALQAAHYELDIIVDRAFGAKSPCSTSEERKDILFKRYVDLAGN
ncbi:DNA methyltransferase [Rhodococcus pyridinivorans]|uniref:DNA methyltransferase n=1 Tax=Rhodococcus pyridinivorans TaxID=103816 RepID=UPI00265B16AE|nr:DNA methyltransferase [Rhodococcus pyridinivorans]